MGTDYVLALPNGDVNLGRKWSYRKADEYNQIQNLLDEVTIYNGAFPTTWEGSELVWQALVGKVEDMWSRAYASGRGSVIDVLVDEGLEIKESA